MSLSATAPPASGAPSRPNPAVVTLAAAVDSPARPAPPCAVYFIIYATAQGIMDAYEEAVEQVRLCPAGRSLARARALAAALRLLTSKRATRSFSPSTPPPSLRSPSWPSSA